MGLLTAADIMQKKAGGRVGWGGVGASLDFIVCSCLIHIE